MVHLRSRCLISMQHKATISARSDNANHPRNFLCAPVLIKVICYYLHSQAALQLHVNTYAYISFKVTTVRNNMQILFLSVFLNRSSASLWVTETPIFFSISKSSSLESFPSSSVSNDQKNCRYSAPKKILKIFTTYNLNCKVKHAPRTSVYKPLNTRAAPFVPS